MSIAVGIDIGGTKVAYGFVNEQGEVLAKGSLQTDLAVTPDVMTERIAGAVKQLAEQNGLALEAMKGIGIGAPGPLDTRGGKLTCPPNLKSWWGFPVVESLGKHLPLPIRMENDATAAALAEKWIGAAREDEHFIFITISTGIGAGIYSHGRLITGSTGNAGDAGFLIVDPSGTPWETVASGTAVTRQASELLGRDVSSKEAFELAAQGDPQMSELVARVFRYIGMGCVSLINVLDPSKIVIGGGVSQVGEPLFSAVRQYVSENALNPSGRETAIVPARLQQDAGLIGAAALIQVDYT
ncbi:ROK family protein [Paenibacillus arenilitoris]|uniref:ROK family protein n=1 Tax=Paenibacillus arenilitoris TaxID=2772299 RepID=A0A927CK28_9BACL|nr:ROK family protein [Paenibacillus arenilitoris]MBD2868043.1 ROK family protein [Paenibacillus arenilitoris]